ncbi:MULTISPECIES: MFS transporter [unclassified Brevibacterium]|uniref:MFS transporter n=1 Tax=unclassified Brevibacterium TaxID=2614124 RepID=UPI00109221A8|nr:MFS transporter [Brevibacterium sp. S22]TGD29735.1 MFS transporter [Brevibacterium sp. S22]
MNTRTSSWAVPVILLGAVLLPLAMSGASVAVPAIGDDLESAGSAASWVVTGYFLAASSLMLVTGSLGDNLGRRRTYRFGIVIYILGAVCAAFAPSITILLAGRVLSGMGAAAVMAGGAATAAAAFTGPARSRMFAAIGTAAAVGLAAGPVVSGGLVETLGWRGAFMAFALAGLAVFGGSFALPESHGDDSVRIDWIGAALVVAGLCSFMLAIAGAPSRGWANPVTLGAGMLALVCFAALRFHARRVASPIIDFSLLRNPNFSGWLIALATVSFGYAGLLAHLPSYLHSVFAYSPSQSGLMLLTPVVPMVLLPMLVGQLSTKVPARLMIGPGLLAIAAGNAWLGFAVSPDSSAPELILPLVLIGLGLGTATGIVDAQAMNHVEPEKHGQAAGLVNTVRGASTTLIMALFGSAVVGLIGLETGDPQLAGRLATGVDIGGDAALAGAISFGWTFAQWGLAAVCAVGAVVVMVLLGRPTRSRFESLPRESKVN